MTIPWMGINFCKSRFRPLKCSEFLFNDSNCCIQLSKEARNIPQLRGVFCTRHVLLAFSPEKLAYFIRGRIFPKELGRHIGFYQSKKKSSHDTPRASDDRFEGWFSPGVKESFSESSRRTKESGKTQPSSSKTTLDSGVNASQTINSDHGE